MIPEDVKTELAPCPFCGGEAEQPTPDAPHGGMVQCSSCGASAFGPKWNRRAILTDREARSGWRDIASLTPEDGMIVVGYGEYRERDGFSPAFMRWHAVLNGWTVTGMPFYPTHWMPIPVAPSSSPYPSREETEGEKEALAAEGRS